MDRKPYGINEPPIQLRQPIIKSVGVTESERYLAKLANKTFLNLWSYPSPFRDQKQARKGDGKELCDLLVVCGPHIIIFSEKSIEWPSGDLNVAWCRWARRALQASAKQAKGAERWIAKFPDRIFLDRTCTIRFPISIPPQEDCFVHKVLIARGASGACKDYFKEGSGSLVIRPAIKGHDHWSFQENEVQPFAVGDLDPSGSFTHVFDDVALDIVLSEQDTVRDFVDYLERRRSFIRSGALNEARGEENLLAYYETEINSKGDHDFVSDGVELPISIDRNYYQNLVKNPQYIAKQREDRVSYLWDELIEVFTVPMLDGTSIKFDPYEYDLRKNEQCVRYMALERRFNRRAYGEAFYGALQKGKETDRFSRVILPTAEACENETAFFLQTFKFLEWMEHEGGYGNYRRSRREFALVYARGLLVRYPHLKRVIGISREPPDQGGMISEDMIYAEQALWTEEERVAIVKDCKDFGVLQGELNERVWSGQEYPEVIAITTEHTNPRKYSTDTNRKQRRAMKARMGRKTRKP